MALAPLPAVVLFARPRTAARSPSSPRRSGRPGTLWSATRRAAQLKASDLSIGTVVHVMPEGIDEIEHPLDEQAKAARLLIRLDPADLDPAVAARLRTTGIVAYSKICTHMGCPVALYEQQTHHLLCPCHQSTFDVSQNCKVIFGPAKRPLPQLPIDGGRRGLPDRQGRLQRGRRPELLGARMSTETTHGETRQLGRRAAGRQQGRQVPRPQDLPRPLVVHAG